MFRKVDSKVNFPQVEQNILRFWKGHDILSRSIEERRGGRHYTFYEGPPTANGSPGVHHVLSRLFKDVICRYKTMRGYHVPRKAGWDTHGLPVELEVESALGFSSKAQIEKYGIAQFNRLCRESVFNYIKEWEQLTERIGCWLDMEHPYITLDNDYIESCWWAIKRMWDKGLIYQGYKVTPHCPRCGTSLSSHEVALGYRDDAEDPSVYIKFKLKPSSVETTRLESLFDSFWRKPAYLLAWTTTPWTLPGNTALAVVPNAEYSVMEGKDDYLIMASLLVGKVGLEGYREVARVKGADIAGVEKGVRYEPLFNPHDYGVERRRFRHYYGQGGILRIALEVQPKDNGLSFPVIDADFVSLSEGTGVVHIAPAFGDVDFEAGEDNDLDFVRDYVDLQGIVRGTYRFAGKPVRQAADPIILEELTSRGLLYRSGTIVHTYPFCWRCGAPLLYYAKEAWYIKTTAVKEGLISGNDKINWYPDYIKHGRFGDWLKNNVDWAFSRERYWGTPVNIWRCQGCGHDECIGSVKELQEGFERLRKAKPGKLAEEIFTGVRNPEELKDLHRPSIDELPLLCPKCGDIMRRVPEVIDCWFDSGAMPIAQWHYPFENRDKFEQNFPADFVCEAVDQTRGWFYSLHAMSTLLFDQPCFKNVICLGHVVDAQGEKMSKSKGNVIDPWTVVNDYGADALRWYMLASVPGENVHRFSAQAVAKTMREFLLTLWNTYSFFTIYANIDCFIPRPSFSVALSELDNWIISELNRLIVEVTKALDNYDLTSAARLIGNFVDNLSNWYVRRSRRRFWRSEEDADKLAAYNTLYQCLVSLSKLLAPFTPFIAEELYQNLVCSVDSEAKGSVQLTDFPVPDEAKINNKLSSEVELVMKISSLGRAARARAGIKVRQPLGKAVIKVESKEEEETIGRQAAQILEEINVKQIEFSREEFPSQMFGYSVASDARHWVAISTELPPELRAEGISREIVRRLQNMRREANFNIADRIVTCYQAEEPVKQVMIDFADYIKQETLSLELTNSSPPEGAYVEKHHISGNDILLAIMRLTNPE